MNDSIETIFIGYDFCQWILTNNYVDNELLAENYLKKLIDNKQIICVNQTTNYEDTDLLKNYWYAFSK